MLRLLTTDDVPAATTLLAQVELASGAANLPRYLRWQPDGCWGWFDDALVGLVTVLRFGAVGFVGCMAVEPARQGRGLGRRLLEHAQAHAPGITTFLLEATAAGERLYRKLGYVLEHESSIVAKSATGASAARPIAPSERAAILALDATAAGSPRDVMIGDLVASWPGLAVAGGYGLVVGERLGPLVARDAGAGAALVAALAPACTNATVSRRNEPALAALEAAGFVERRRLARMRLGPEVAARTDWIWTYASAGAG